MERYAYSVCCFFSTVNVKWRLYSCTFSVSSWGFQTFESRFCACHFQTVKRLLKAVLSCESTCAATLRKRWWHVPAVGGCMPTIQSCLTTSYDRAPWKVDSVRFMKLSLVMLKKTFNNRTICVVSHRSEVPVLTLLQTFCNRKTSEGPHEDPRSVMLHCAFFFFFLHMSLCHDEVSIHTQFTKNDTPGVWSKSVPYSWRWSFHTLFIYQVFTQIVFKTKTLFLHVTHYNNPGIVMDCEPDELISIFLDLFCFIVRASSFKMKHFTTISWLDATKNKNSPSQCLFLICWACDALCCEWVKKSCCQQTTL